MTDYTTPDSTCPKPTTINGFPILRAALAPARKGEQRFHVILVDRGSDYEERYVVSDLCVGSTSWTQGYYISSLGEARFVFATRSAHFKAREV